MHELGIALWMLERASEVARRCGAGRVEAVEARIGELSGVEPSALRFAFEAARAAVPLCECAVLKVQWVPVRVSCPACGVEGAPGPFSFACGACANPETTVVAGEELELVAVEIETLTEAAATGGAAGEGRQAEPARDGTPRHGAAEE